jgi:hypothetical protein
MFKIVHKLINEDFVRLDKPKITEILLIFQFIPI